MPSMQYFHKLTSIKTLINNMQTFNSGSFQKYGSNQNEISTAQNFYNVDESYKLYLKLMEENLQLKSRIENAKISRKEGYQSRIGQQRRGQGRHIDQYGQINGHNEGHGYRMTYEQYNNAVREGMDNEGEFMQGKQQENGVRQVWNMNEQTELPLWSMMERNKYLQNKMERMRRQYEKQHSSIKSIESSSKWRNKDKCHDGTCYHNKYLQLLRVRSPFY